MKEEMYMKSEIIEKIKKLKNEKNACILAHYYLNDEIQEIADYIGDSYYLSKIAKDLDCDIIIFCGVRFMAETAKILSPNKKVLLPVKTASCYMADTIDEKFLKMYKKQFPKRKIISYVNTTAAIKALSDICVTSANALKVIDMYKDEEVFYLPDKNLATYANSLQEKQIYYHNGYCDIHNELNLKDLIAAKELHPFAKVLIHPEAPLELLKNADYVGSTKGMLDFVKTSQNDEFIVGTEKGIMFKLRMDNPNKKFYLLSDKLICHSMKETTLDDVLNALLEKPNSRFEEIILDEKIIKDASTALNKMLEVK